MKTGVIIAAAGAGTRMGGVTPKQFIDIGGMPMLVRTARVFSRCKAIDGMIVCAPPDLTAETENMLSEAGIESDVIPGAGTRQGSVRLAVEHMSKCHGDWDIVLIHDAARPYVTEDIILECIEAARRRGAAVPVVPVKDTIRSRERTLDRNELFSVQTPQGFDTDIIVEAHRAAHDDGFEGTDDISLAERIGTVPEMTEGSYANIKITTPEDIRPGFVTGIGYDAHRLAEGRVLIIGGVDIPFEKGLLGHSDADVLLHAVTDAILGAAALGDIGKHFPDTDERYRGISSLILLEKARELIADAGYLPRSVDATVIAERPKIAGHTDQMQENIAAALHMDVKHVNVKGTTTEGLGFTGRGEGIAAWACCTLTEEGE